MDCGTAKWLLTDAVAGNGNVDEDDNNVAGATEVCKLLSLHESFALVVDSLLLADEFWDARVRDDGKGL